MAKVSKRGGFSDRNKIKPENTEIQLKEFDKRTRVQLQNMISQFYQEIYGDEYYGGEKIEELFPEQYKNLMRQCMVFIFDGYDEMDEAQQRIFEKTD